MESISSVNLDMDCQTPGQTRDLRKYIYRSGAGEDPMVLYRSFRGKQPTIRPRLEKRGLL